MLTWFMIWISNGFYPKLHMSGYLRIGLLIMAAVVWGIYHHKRPRIHKKVMTVVVAVAALQTVSIIVNGIYPALDIFQYGILIGAVAFTCILDESSFIEQYRKGLVYVCAISDILFFIGGFTGLLKLIPGVFLQPTNANATYTVLGTFVIKLRTQLTYYRNFGIFSEPGQFHIFVCFGLIIELFTIKEVNWKRISLFVVTLITCNSTNGFLTGILILLAYLYDKPQSEDKREKRVRNLLKGVFIVSVIFLVLYGNQIDAVVEAREKLREFSGSFTYSDLGSGVERRRAIVAAINIFLQNPVTGLGYAGMDAYIHSLSSSGFIMTFSPLNWFARFGLIYGVLANYLYFLYFWYFPDRIPAKIILSLGILSMISAQAVNADIFTWVIIFFSVRNLQGRLRPKKQGGARCTQ